MFSRAFPVSVVLLLMAACGGERSLEMAEQGGPYCPGIDFFTEPGQIFVSDPAAFTYDVYGNAEGVELEPTALNGYDGAEVWLEGDDPGLFWNPPVKVNVDGSKLGQTTLEEIELRDRFEITVKLKKTLGFSAERRCESGRITAGDWRAAVGGDQTILLEFDYCPVETMVLQVHEQLELSYRPDAAPCQPGSAHWYEWRPWIDGAPSSGASAQGGVSFTAGAMPLSWAPAFRDVGAPAPDGLNFFVRYGELERGLPVGVSFGPVGQRPSRIDVVCRVAYDGDATSLDKRGAFALKSCGRVINGCKTADACTTGQALGAGDLRASFERIDPWVRADF